MVWKLTVSKAGRSYESPKGIAATARTLNLTGTAYFRLMTTPSQTLNRCYSYLWWLNGQSSYPVPGSPTPSAPADIIAALEQFLSYCT